MQCPQDGQTLAMTTREGIEIDYCPTCRGVWLDRGELDKIIERSAATVAPAAPAGGTGYPESRGSGERGYRPDVPGDYRGDRDDRGYRRDDDDDDRRRYGPHDGYGHRKKRSFLGDLFDFD